MQSKHFGVFKITRYFFQKKYYFCCFGFTATHKLIATTLSGIAEFENNRRKERQKQGIRAAQKEGKYQGRKTIINQTLIQRIKDLKEKKNLSVTEIAKVVEISRPTVSKVLKNELGYVSNRFVQPEETYDAK
jgi:DNA invertase Pin-like site-specific DNA recombinase